MAFKKQSSFSTTLFTLFWSFCLWGINASPKLIICSLFFIAFMLTGLFLKEALGTKKAIKLFAWCLSLNLGLLLFQGKSLHLYSFLPLIAGGYISWVVFEKLPCGFSRSSRILISLLTGIATDGLLIAPWEYLTFGADKLPKIFMKSLGFKSLYAGIASLGITLLPNRFFPAGRSR